MPKRSRCHHHKPTACLPDSASKGALLRHPPCREPPLELFADLFPRELREAIDRADRALHILDDKSCQAVIDHLAYWPVRQVL